MRSRRPAAARPTCSSSRDAHRMRLGERAPGATRRRSAAACASCFAPPLRAAAFCCWIALDLARRSSCRRGRCTGVEIDQRVEVARQRNRVVRRAAHEAVGHEAVRDRPRRDASTRSRICRPARPSASRRRARPRLRSRHCAILNVGAPRARQPAHRAVEELVGQRRVADAAVEAARSARRGCARAPAPSPPAARSGGSLSRWRVVDALQHVARQAGERERALGGEHVADLLPRRLHELVLVLADDLGAPAGGQSIARLQAQAVEPVR